MTISQFAAYSSTSTNIIFVFYGKVPDESTTTPIKITTYRDSTNTTKLDEDSLTAKMVPLALYAPIRSYLIYNTVSKTISESDSSTTDITFGLQPSSDLNSSSIIVVKFPTDDFLVNSGAISANKCKLYDPNT